MKESWGGMQGTWRWTRARVGGDITYSPWICRECVKCARQRMMAAMAQGDSARNVRRYLIIACLRVYLGMPLWLRARSLATRGYSLSVAAVLFATCSLGLMPTRARHGVPTDCFIFWVRPRLLQLITDPVHNAQLADTRRMLFGLRSRCARLLSTRRKPGCCACFVCTFACLHANDIELSVHDST